jgi:hypothetical protein
MRSKSCAKIDAPRRPDEIDPEALQGKALCQSSYNSFNPRSALSIMIAHVRNM